MKIPRRFVDLSIYLENDVLSDPPPLAPKITYETHAEMKPVLMDVDAPAVRARRVLEQMLAAEQETQ
jgi:hypothetical protein